MTAKQKRHFDRKRLKMLKRELEGWKRFRTMGINVLALKGRLPQ